MLTKNRAIDLGAMGIRTTLYHKHLRNADGTALRARITGKCRTWKRNPHNWELPVKRGLRDSSYIPPDGPLHMRPNMWSEVEPPGLLEKIRWAKLVGLTEETPLPILADALEDAGILKAAARIREWLAVAD